jgi:hypothetical protein
MGWFPSDHYQIILHKQTVTRKYSLICYIEISLMETKMKYITQGAILKLLLQRIVSIHKYLPYPNLCSHAGVQRHSHRKQTLAWRLDTNTLSEALIHGNRWYVNFLSFYPLHSEHSDAQLRYIECCNTVLCAEDRQQTDRRYEVGVVSSLSKWTQWRTVTVHRLL